VIYFGSKKNLLLVINLNIHKDSNSFMMMLPFMPVHLFSAACFVTAGLVAVKESR